MMLQGHVLSAWQILNWMARKEKIIICAASTFHVSRLPLCGDVATNPGPAMPKAPKSCNECNKTIRRNQDAILCAECSGWFHAKCLHMSKASFQYYSYSQASNWTCGLCSLPKLTAKCYQQSSYADSDSSDSDNQNEM